LSAGVYFTADPTNAEAGWLIEWVDGLGDTLVSGERTPRRVRRDNASDSAVAHVLLPIIERVERLLQFPVDLEWAIDHEGQPWGPRRRAAVVRLSRQRHEARRHGAGARAGPSVRQPAPHGRAALRCVAVCDRPAAAAAREDRPRPAERVDAAADAGGRLLPGARRVAVFRIEPDAAARMPRGVCASIAGPAASKRSVDVPDGRCPDA